MDKTEAAIFTKLELERRFLNHQDSLRKFGVKQRGLFGSYVKNAAHEHSDCDLFVESEKLPFDKYMGYVFSLKICLKIRLTL